MLKLSGGTVVTDGQSICNQSVYISDGKIVAVTEDNLPFDKELDASECYITPGFIDIHTHGCGGFDYTHDGEAGIFQGTEYALKHGTTALLPTICAAPYDTIRRGLTGIRDSAAKARAHILGANIEGPYFAPEMCGAQDPSCITEPIAQDYKALCDEFPGLIRIWSYAPERDKNGEFCAYITSRGIIPSAGHSAAQYSDMLTGMEKGLKSVTHLFSCTSTIVREKGFRKLGIIETAFLHKELFCEAIADGKHLPPELLRMIYQIKGHEKVCLITDSLAPAGTDKKEFFFNGENCIIEDGIVKLPDRSAFAGSVATGDMLLKTAVEDANIPLAHAVAMLTATPASLIGQANKGSIRPGMDADILFISKSLAVKKVILHGEELQLS